MPAYSMAPAVVGRMQGWDGSNWQNLRVESTDWANLRVGITKGGMIADVKYINSDSMVTSLRGLIVLGMSYGFGGSTWDRLYTHYLTSEYSFTATGTSETITIPTGLEKYTWQILSDASGSNATVRLEGSIDGSNFFTLDEWSGTGNTMRHVVNKPVRCLRFNVTNMGDATEIKCRLFGMR